MSSRDFGTGNGEGSSRQVPTIHITSTADEDFESLSERSLSPPDHRTSLNVKDRGKGKSLAHRAKRRRTDSEPQGQTSERPNRFKGRASDWKRYTEDDRAIAESLDLLRARDLSIHLYNVFMLKQRLKDKGPRAWRPRPIWTAWPLEPEMVPRPLDTPGDDSSGWETENDTEDFDYPAPKPRRAQRRSGLKQRLEGQVTEQEEESNGTDDESEQIGEQQNSRADLEEMLMSLVSKEARVRFQARMQAFKTKPQKRRKAREDERANTDLSSAGMTSDDGGSLPSTSDDDRPLLVQLAAWREKVKPTLPSESDLTYDIAIPNTDLKREAQIVGPSTRSIMASFDKVLLALHRSRKNIRRVSARRLSRAISANPHSHMSFALSQTSSRSRSRSMALQQKRKRQASKSSQAAVSDEDESADKTVKFSNSELSRSQSRSRRPSFNTKQVRRRSRYKLRDWSEVLGMAAVTQAFSPAVIERARQRCADLLGENMEFSTFQ